VNDEVRRRLKEAMEDLRVVVHEMALAPETSARVRAAGLWPRGMPSLPGADPPHPRG
jgi:hypothetical protein